MKPDRAWNRPVVEIETVDLVKHPPVLGEGRCRQCDRVLMEPSDPHRETCNGCEKCRTSCWALIDPDGCLPKLAVDWRGRALKAEADLAQARKEMSEASDDASVSDPETVFKDVPDDFFVPTFADLPKEGGDGEYRAVGTREKFLYVSFRNGEWWVPYAFGPPAAVKDIKP